MPTVLSLLNLPIPEQALGKPLIALDGEEKNIPNRYLFSELGRGGLDMKAIFTDEWKYVYNYKLAEYGPRYRLKMAWRENDWNYLFNYASFFESLFRSFPEVPRGRYQKILLAILGVHHTRQSQEV